LILDWSCDGIKAVIVDHREHREHGEDVRSIYRIDDIVDNEGNALLNIG